MDINIIDYDELADLALVNKLMQLGRIIKSSCVLNIYFLNGKYSLLRWVKNHHYHEKSLNVFIVSDELDSFIKKVMKADNILVLRSEKKRLDIIEEVVKYILNQGDIYKIYNTTPEEPNIILTEPEALLLYNMFMNSKKPLGKKNWDAKKKLREKFGFKTDYEIYLWWLLTESLPLKILCNSIKIV